MAKFIKLTLRTDRRTTPAYVWFNVDNIVAFHEPGGEGTTIATLISDPNDRDGSPHVHETPEQILSLIEEAQKS